jgi:MarR family 2-MHQ and catechol resistance regulon transcriptional repressor
MKKGEKKRRRSIDAYQLLQQAASFASDGVDTALHDYGLTASQFGVLDTLDARGPVHQQELAEALSRSKAQMTAIIDALESRGLVRRERHAVDRRFITVHLTLSGTDLLADVRPVRAEAIVYMMGALTPPQRLKLRRLCRRLLRQPIDEVEAAEGEVAVVADDTVADAMPSEALADVAMVADSASAPA